MQYIQSYNKNTRKEVILVFLWLTLNIFHTFFSVSLVDFGQLNVSWAIVKVSRSSALLKMDSKM